MLRRKNLWPSITNVSACIYRADHLEAKRYHSDPSYLPKWKKLEQEEGGASTGTHCIPYILVA